MDQVASFLGHAPPFELLRVLVRADRLRIVASHGLRLDVRPLLNRAIQLMHRDVFWPVWSSRAPSGAGSVGS
jgi:hypothetical protein